MAALFSYVKKCLELPACQRRSAWLWFAITRYNIREENLYLPADLSPQLQGWIKKDYDKLLLWAFVALVAIAIVGKYGADLFA